MKKLTKIATTFLILNSVFFGFNAFAEKVDGDVKIIGNLKSKEIDNQLLIRFKDGTSQKQVNAFMAKYGLKTLKYLEAIKVYQVQTPLEIKADKLLKTVEKESLVKYAELNHAVSMQEKNKKTEKMDYAKLIGKDIEVKGIYQTSRSGAVLKTDNGSLSFLDSNDKVLITVEKLQQGQSVSLKGTIKKAKGFNITNDLGIRVLTINK